MLSVLVCSTRSAPACERLFQHVDRPLVVDRLEFPPIPDPEVGIGGQVVDPAPAPQGLAQCLTVPNVRKDDLDSGRQMVNIRPRPFDHPHLLARIDQLLHQMAADEPRAPVTMLSPFMRCP